MALLVYVDDIILIRDDISHVNEVKNFLNKNFKIKDIGQLSFFSRRRGNEIEERNACKPQKICRGMLAAKPCLTPMTKYMKFTFDQNEPIHDEEAYGRAVGLD